MTDKRKQRLKRKLQESRFRLFKFNKEFASPLLDMIFVATKEVQRISTNGTCIYFDPDWLQKLGDTELDFILAHQLMHIALGHIERPKYYKGDRFHLACDIVANSNLEQLGWTHERLPHIGKIFYETFYPSIPGHQLSSIEALDCVPFDPAEMRTGVRRNFMIDAETWWDRKADRGGNGEIVLSPDDEEPEDLIGDRIDFGDGRFFVVKEAFIKDEEYRFGREESNDENEKITQWEKCVTNELISLRSTAKQSSDYSDSEEFSERSWQQSDTTRLDWRKLIDSFIQEDVCDYFFTPPDKRFQDSDFFLPDYNVLDEKPKEVLFMVDTSGSIGDEMLTVVYGEIKGAINQFNGGLVGALGFFDEKVYTPTYFSEIDNLLHIKPYGGGGTNFNCIFDFVKRNMLNNTPTNIIIFTDGQANFPNKNIINGIPVLWLISDERIRPPWGKYAYVRDDILRNYE